MHTQPNSERAVYDRLRQLEYTPYLPRIKVQRCHAGRIDWVYRPFLPRYLFVQDDGRGVSAIKRTSGVSDVVRAGLEPVRVGEAVLEQIRQREVNGVVQLEDKSELMFRPGQKLLVTAGLLMGRDVLFSRMRGTTRALVFLQAVIGRIESELPIHTLRAA